MKGGLLGGGEVEKGSDVGLEGFLRGVVMLGLAFGILLKGLGVCYQSVKMVDADVNEDCGDCSLGGI